MKLAKMGKPCFLAFFRVQFLVAGFSTPFPARPTEIDERLLFKNLVEEMSCRSQEGGSVIAIEEALLVLKGWDGRRLRVIFEGSGVQYFSAACNLYAVDDAGASFVSGKEVGFVLDFRGCIAEYAEPPRDTAPDGADSGLFFRGEDFMLTIFTVLGE